MREQHRSVTSGGTNLTDSIVFQSNPVTIMSKTNKDDQNIPIEPQPDDQTQESNRDSDQSPEQPGKLSPSTTTNPRIKNT